MTTTDVTIVSKRGMVTIPKELREKHKLSPGDRVTFIEDQGNILIVPLREFESFRNQFVTRKEMQEHVLKAHLQDLELE